MLLTSKEHGEDVRTEVHAGHGVRILPAQALGQVELPKDDFSKADELLNLFIRGDGVGRPVERCDGLASLDANQFVPELGAIVLTILRDDEGAEGSVDVELGFFIFHGYRIARRTENATIFFAILQSIFCEAGTLLEYLFA